MIVLIADYLPPAVRGRIKLWFIEIKPNVFVSGIKDFLGQKIIDFLYSFCPPESSLIIFMSTSKAPGYKIRWLGYPKRQITEVLGLQLVLEKKF
jgi:CRISPR-associated protein Cas2